MRIGNYESERLTNLTFALAALATAFLPPRCLAASPVLQAFRWLIELAVCLRAGTLARERHRLAIARREAGAKNETAALLRELPPS
jgi:hypothetical protein